MPKIKDAVLDKFLRYIAIDTESDYNANTYPSTEKQFNLGRLLVKELKDIGLVDVTIDEYCYVTATLPSNTKKETKTIGFLAHLDTSPDMSGKGVNPLMFEDYQGGDLYLNEVRGIILSPEVFPSLSNYLGDTIITTDGTTLLGADDKAGIAEIMAAMEYLVAHPEIEHGTIKVAFTPDEEIGRGMDYFNVERFNVDYAYTVDGGAVGELVYETFNAATAKVTINGNSIHPGSAKNKMVNSIQVGMELAAMLPAGEKPEFTEGYEGFTHLFKIKGNVEQTCLEFMIRDHNKEAFTKKKMFLQEAAAFLNKKYGSGTVDLELIDSYQNMKEMIEPVFEIVALAERAMEAVGVTPFIAPVRGGTDGARLSFMGIPCPNIFTGGHNYHGKFEYIPVSSMEKAVRVLVKICELYVEPGF